MHDNETRRRIQINARRVILAKWCDMSSGGNVCLPREFIILYVLYRNGGRLTYPELVSKVAEVQSKLPLCNKYKFDRCVIKKDGKYYEKHKEALSEEEKEIAKPFDKELEEDLCLLDSYNIVNIEYGFCPEEFNTLYECEETYITLTNHGEAIVYGFIRSLIRLAGSLASLYMLDQCDRKHVLQDLWQLTSLLITMLLMR